MRSTKSIGPKSSSPVWAAAAVIRASPLSSTSAAMPPTASMIARASGENSGSARSVRRTGSGRVLVSVMMSPCAAVPPEGRSAS